MSGIANAAHHLSMRRMLLETIEKVEGVRRPPAPIWQRNRNVRPHEGIVGLDGIGARCSATKSPPNDGG